jgi:hypothetical protein
MLPCKIPIVNQPFPHDIPELDRMPPVVVDIPELDLIPPVVVEDEIVFMNSFIV